MATLFAFLALIGWGTGDIFVTIASRKIGNVHAYFWGFLLALILTTLYIPFAGEFPEIGMFIVAFLINIIHSLGNISYFRALEVGNASIVGTISGGGFPVVAVLMSIFFFGETPSLLQLVAIFLVVSGIVLSSLDISLLKEKGLKGAISNSGVPYAIGGMLGWGISLSLIRIPVETIGWFWSLYPIYLIALILPIFKRVRKNIFKVFRASSIVTVIVLYTLLVTMADFAYNIGILSGYTSTVAPIAGAFPVLFVVLSRFVFHERLNPQQKIGITSSLVGVVLISLT
ncbi:DMT family transporter [Candidatus Gottesmanbacteria bacterium]|nr:DMT family transporter [Candidatus Gottesmanbacteria bacterium]